MPKLMHAFIDTRDCRRASRAGDAVSIHFYPQPLMVQLFLA